MSVTQAKRHAGDLDILGLWSDLQQVRLSNTVLLLLENLCKRTLTVAHMA